MADYMRTRRRAERAAKRSAPATPDVAFDAANAQAVLDLLAEQVEAVRRDTDSTVIERARTIGQLARTLLLAVDMRAVMPRLELLEAAVLSDGEDAAA